MIVKMARKSTATVMHFRQAVHLRVDATRYGLKERRLPAAGGRPGAAGAFPRAALRLAVSTRRCTLRQAPGRSRPHLAGAR